MIGLSYRLVHLLNRVSYFANEAEVLYPAKCDRDRMLVKGSRVCTVPRPERDLSLSISQTSDML